MPEEPDASRVIEYASPGTTRPRHPARTAVVVLAVVWLFASLFTGVGSDFVRFPVAKKVAMTVTTVIVVCLMFATSGRRERALVAAAVYLLWMLLMMVSLWFWN